MVVFGSQCPNSDTDSVGESRDAWRVVQKRRFALTVFPRPLFSMDMPTPRASPAGQWTHSRPSARDPPLATCAPQNCGLLAAHPRNLVPTWVPRRAAKTAFVRD